MALDGLIRSTFDLILQGMFPKPTEFKRKILFRAVTRVVATVISLLVVYALHQVHADFPTHVWWGIVCLVLVGLITFFVVRQL